MGFDSKFNLSNSKFEQAITDSINLSGCTEIYGNLNISQIGSIDSYSGYKVSGVNILNTDVNSNIYIGTGNTSLIMGNMTQDCVILPKLKLRTAPEGSGGYLCYNPSTCLVEQTIGGTGGTGSMSVSNGLSLSGNNIVLGGSLTGNTKIDLNNNNLDISNSNIGFINSGTGFDSDVYTLQLQTDGKILVGGSFTTYSGVTANYIIRLNSDGSIDNSFNSGTGFDSSVLSILQQSDGKILVGGDFTTYNGVTANYIIRLNSDGSIDNSFNTGAGFDSYVLTIQLQTDGKILVGGSFTTYSGVTANRIIRLNSDGSIDNSFNSGTGFDDNGVTTLQLQTDGKILVGGFFTTYSGVTANRIIRLNSDGSIDNSFNSGTGFNNGVQTLELQSDGKILVGGYFTSYSGVTANYIIRLNSDGSIDNSFNSGTGFDDNGVTTLQLQTDGKILVGGSFTTYNGETANYIIRLNSDGSIDNTFNIGDGFNSGVFSILQQSDGKILVGGDFTTYNGETANYIIRLNSDGSIDNISVNNTFRFNGYVAEYDDDYSQYYTARSIPDVAFVTGRTGGGSTANNGLTKVGNNIVLGGALTGDTIITLNSNNFEISNNYEGFNPNNGFEGGINSLSLQTDGKILAGGQFTSYSGVTANYIIRLNSDGSIDNTFNIGTGFDSSVFSIVQQSDGKILVGGFFTTYNGVTANYIIRLNQDGSIDNTFNIGDGFNSGVFSILQQSDGKILVGGYFSTYSGVTANRIIRLNSNGSIDNTFNSGTGFDDDINLLSLQTDGKILVGGYFTSYSGETANYIIRLNSDGSIDNTFNYGTGFDSSVFSIVQQSDGKILAGGYFTTYNEITANYIIRLNSDGSIDNTFNIGDGFNSGVFSILQQSDGKILVGGDFTTYNGETANYIIRLNSDGSIDNISVNNTFRFNGYVAEYDGDYSQYYTARSIPDVAFVTGRTSSGGTVNITANNGLTKVGNNIALGGDLTGNTYINLNYNVLEISNDIYTLRFNGQVIEYGGDYSANYSSRSIPDVDYIIQNYYDINEINSYTGKTDMKISKIENNYISGATNGLSKTGKNLKLGGALTGNTVIDLNSKKFEILNVTNYFNIGTGFDDIVFSIVQQSDGKILAGGSFTTYSGVTANRIIRLNSNGTIDNTFNSAVAFNSSVRSIKQQTDGKILIGGDFSTPNRIIRLNSDGSIDNTFNSVDVFNSGVYIIYIQLDEKILVGGQFSSYNGVTANRIIRLNSDGTIDNTFNSGTGFNGSVNSITQQSDGKILICGHFTSYSGVTANRIIRLNSNGTIDNTFNIGSGFNNGVLSIQIQSDGKILIGGGFTTYNGVTVNKIIRLNSNGTIDNSFNSGTGFDSSVYSISILTDDKILVGGYFTTYSGVTANRIIRLNSDGSIDNTFNSGTGFNSIVFSIVQQSDEKILVGGYFTSYGGVTANYIIRLNSDGNKDITISIFRFNGKVAEYEEDYSQYYTARSIPDVAFVTGRTSGGTGTTNVSNGLTKIGNNIVLGGALTGNTNLSGNYTLNINGGAKLSTTCGYQISGNTILKTSCNIYPSIYLGNNLGNLSNDESIFNIGIGHNIMNNIDASAASNIGIGYNNLQSLNYGNDNIVIGSNGGAALTSGSSNILLGTNSQTLTTGSNNISLGNNAGCGNVTGSKNIFIGYSAGSNETGSGKLYIGTGNTSLIMGDMVQDCVILPKLKLRTAPTGSGGYLCYNPSTCLVEQTIGGTGGTIICSAVSLGDYYTTCTTTLETICKFYCGVISGNTLINNGDKLIGKYVASGSCFVGVNNNYFLQISVNDNDYIPNTNICACEASNIIFNVLAIRNSNSSLKYMINQEISYNPSNNFCNKIITGNISGLDFTNPITFDFIGYVNSSTNITLRADLGYLEYHPAKI